MKSISYILSIVFITLIMSCKKDNYDAPSSQLTGVLMYNGDSIGVEYDRVPFQLYQYGFGKVGAIDATFDQSGIMHALLFNGEYKLVIQNGQGPFLWNQTAAGNPDSLAISVNGSQNINIEVTPYYMIRNPQINGSGGNVAATFQLEKIITDSATAKNVDNVTLFINKTQFVSGSNNIATAGMAGSEITDPQNINLSVAVPSITPTQDYVFARIGVKIAGVEDVLFSPLVKISY